MKTQTQTLNFKVLYAAMYSKVLQFISYQVTDYNLAKDIAGDIFLKIYEKQHLFNPEKANPSTWAWTIVRNSLTDYYRTKKLNAIHLSKMVTEEGDQIELRGSSDTLRDVENNELMNRIMSAIGDLPESHREIVYLNLIEDLKFEDVAKRTDTPLGTVKVVVMKAKNVLSRKLNDLA
jgi:RNA polymerase sigma-70 factor (ECF subfamily)